MLGWSINLFRVGGIQLAVHFSFLLLLAVNAFDGYADAGWPGLWWSTAVLAAFFGCVVLHEFGHCLTAIRFGVRVPRILLLPIGGMAEFDGLPREPRREVLITVAGPAVNFVIAGLLWLLLPAPAAEESTGAIPTLTESLHLLMRWNLAMGLFNLLPAFPMDGGRLLRASLATRLPYLRATFWAATCGKVICVLGVATALWLGEPLLIVLFVFIFIVGEMEYRAAQRRERDDAHWRAVIARQFAAAGTDADRTPPAGA